MKIWGGTNNPTGAGKRPLPEREMKLVIYIINPEDYANSEYNHALSCTTREHWDWWNESESFTDYIYLTEIEVDMDFVPRDLAVTFATEALDKRMNDIRAKTDAELTALDNRKANLLSLPAPGGE